MTPDEFIAFVNSIIMNTEHQEALIAWKKKHKINQEGKALGEIGQGYYQNMKKQNAHLLTSSKACLFPMDRSEWMEKRVHFANV